MQQVSTAAITSGAPVCVFKIALSFGRRLRVLRRERGLSQEELAWKADSELSQISRMERGIVNAGLSQVFKIAEALNVHPRELFDFEFPEEGL